MAINAAAHQQLHPLEGPYPANREKKMLS